MWGSADKAPLVLGGLSRKVIVAHYFSTNTVLAKVIYQINSCGALVARTLLQTYSFDHMPFEINNPFPGIKVGKSLLVTVQNNYSYLKGVNLSILNPIKVDMPLKEPRLISYP